MTEEEVLFRIAAKLGYSVERRSPSNFIVWDGGSITGRAVGPSGTISSQLILNNRDRLAEVVRKLTPREIENLSYRLTGNADGARWLSFDQLKFILFLPPLIFAQMLAESMIDDVECAPHRQKNCRSCTHPGGD